MSLWVSDFDMFRWLVYVSNWFICYHIISHDGSVANDTLRGDLYQDFGIGFQVSCNLQKGGLQGPTSLAERGRTQRFPQKSTGHAAAAIRWFLRHQMVRRGTVDRFGPSETGLSRCGGSRCCCWGSRSQRHKASKSHDAGIGGGGGAKSPVGWLGGHR